MGSDNAAALEAAMGYCFTDRALLRMALTHRSFGVPHNERLEFLGDSVLNCVMAAALFARFTELPEGDLSRLRAHLVKQDALHQVALDLHLGNHLRFGDGERQSGGKTRPSILADALEALFGAIYLEAGFECAGRVIRRLFATQFDALAPGQSLKDAKTRLQEWLQGRHFPLPCYQLLETRGAAHKQVFHIACRLEKPDLETEGEGNSRRLAEQAAATRALEILEHST
ncbi:MAG: ribonuclease III [Zoogloeaceae bacterium]|jgi:ribonuclease-3|nr:ribonuclease III [Zoogloeaceae bacterium]